MNRVASKLEPVQNQFQAKLKDLNLVPLNEKTNDYEPDQQQIIEYAQFLGFQLPKDADFLWIAKEGLKAPLPQGWKPYHDDSDDLFFVNPSNGIIQSEHPLDEFYRSKFLNQKNKFGKLTHEEQNPLVRINEEEQSQLTNTITGLDEKNARRQEEVDSQDSSLKKMTSSDFIQRQPANTTIMKSEYASPHGLVTEQSEPQEMDLIEEYNVKMSQAYSNKIRAQVENIDVPLPAFSVKPDMTELKKSQTEVQELAGQLKNKTKLLEELTRERIRKEKQLIDMEMQFEAKKQRIVDSYRNRLKRQLQTQKSRKNKQIQSEFEGIRKTHLAMLNRK